MLQLWSPYADISSLDMLKASESLPMPTGKASEIKETDNLLDVAFIKYKGLFNINRVFDKKFEVDKNKIDVSLNINTPLLLRLLGKFLRETNAINKPSDKLQTNFVSLVAPGIISTKEQFDALFTNLLLIVNKHNLYFDKLHLDKIGIIESNHLMKSMYDTIIDPVNLTLAHLSVDATTGPLKDVADISTEAEEAKHRTPGNFVNLYESIVENQVGKDGIGINAVGLKSFFALTLYYNYVLNNSTEGEQLKLLIGSNHAGKLLGKLLYTLLANVRSNDPSTIKNLNVMRAIALRGDQSDAAIILSALLSLSTDSQ